jgi:hypothetical protein
VFDAATTVFTDPVTGDNVAIVAFGFTNPDIGRSSQTLLFRESDAELPPHDGHHIAFTLVLARRILKRPSKMF